MATEPFKLGDIVCLKGYDRPMVVEDAEPLIDVYKVAWLDEDGRLQQARLRGCALELLLAPQTVSDYLADVQRQQKPGYNPPQFDDPNTYGTALGRADKGSW